MNLKISHKVRQFDMFVKGFNQSEIFDFRYMATGEQVKLPY